MNPVQDHPACVLAFDMGGTYIKSACITPGGTLLGGIHMTPSHSGGELEEVLGGWSEAASILWNEAGKLGLPILGAGVSTPGPFDFEKGQSWMRQKFLSLYGLDLAREIRKAAGLPGDLPFRFIQDANAFLAGEHLCGAARGYDDCSGITLGTGLGFTSMVEGKIMTNGRGAPYIALYRQPFGNGVLEDVVSARGICRLYREWSGRQEDESGITAKEVGRLARQGDEAALGVMRYLGGILGRSIAYLLSHTRSGCLVLGGQISKDFDLFAGPLRGALEAVESLRQVAPAAHPADAALYGAAALYTGDGGLNQ